MSRTRTSPSRRSYDFRIPNCSECGRSLQRNDVNEWFCLHCADEWLRRHIDKLTRGKSIFGVHLPTGVTDPRRLTASFRDAFPNRAARRRAMRTAR